MSLTVSISRATTSEQQQSGVLPFTPSRTEVQFSRPDSQKDTPQKSSNDKNRLDHLLAAMPAGVLVIDHKGKVSLANNQAKALLDEPLMGETWRNVIQRAFRPRADDGHEVSMKNGKRVKIQISPLTEEKGQLVVITDLTETRELQNRVSHMQKLSSLGKMMAALAHQVRTPLSSALLYAENLRTLCPNGELADKFSEKLLLRLRDLESQVNDMLLFAKSDSNQIVNQVECCELLNTIASQVEAQMQQHSVLFDAKCSATSTQLMVNQTSLVGAVSNLLNNAIQACNHQQDAAVSLSINEKEINQTSFIEIKVMDNGKGLGDITSQQLFEPFFTTKSQGTGLGLAVVSAVAKSHQGHVDCGNLTADDSQTSGAWFAIYLPVVCETQDATATII